uniref:Uncharacterized protein n=1 Tax=Anguilla anguilla TaxID=7936 RepID=A0A0E9URC3_ANGAN
MICCYIAVDRYNHKRKWKPEA